ncbi:alpha/beta hydrolase [Xanthomonas hortorum pv. pelargonii]|uniref:Haloalkane dehalogenase n=2 Tax=Xanthomonas hortorum pv. pelargonii TaxID=453602 RepID=A0A6V7BJE5_9XANT|nr:alpha/beta hydrolase [Xanthomonas hortorum]MCE4354503.1 alpha/beta hydrolase [Xanthomonas hortorum pv. pelargonii]MCM5525576.1 alpha/beta hydrolase [Xanthomonas hortorum pv. pelargonii]MCM5538018.1 alpha/beta hydrolase [Xanthomonas hortorum pv. pelargonii]MCM5542193.1 alpha/beta hydrolase [Xanthomonas hortorum pv. pelargonii]MCM5546798.1 alpha/beta hydrolase [Xanthomonas hortorum pv. pelargonii]
MAHTDALIAATTDNATTGISRRTLLLASCIGTAYALGAGALGAAERSNTTIATKETAMPIDDTSRVSFHTQQVGDVEVFYREAGRQDAPVLLLLHGFPSASHMFRDLMPLLADRYRLIAPDLPGFGNTKAPPRGQFDYTFENLYKVIESFTEALGLASYSMYVFDYGAPVGFRLAAANPHKVSAIISQNGNAYLEGFSDQWGQWQTYWREPTAANRQACRGSLSPQTIRDWQYGTGADPSKLSPDGYTLDIAYMARPGAEEIQLDLILDYRSNVAAYPRFHAYFRKHQPPLLAVWGKHDPAFIPPGAQAYRKDLPKADVHLLDAGHFALETHAPEIARYIGEFLSRTFKASA